MYEHIAKLTTPTDRILHVWFEPWAEGLGFPANMVVELRATSPIEGKLEIDVTSERTAVYGWAESTLQVLVDGQIVHSFDTPFPGLSSTISTKDAISMLFGSPPVPTSAERSATLVKSPWWRFWR